LVIPGFIASHVVAELLKRGFTVRAVVRDPSQEEKHAHLKALDGAAERLTFCAGDLLKAGSYDEAFAGADAVVHCAAVVDIGTVSGKDAEEQIVKPSVTGTENVVASIAKCPSVKRLVQTSSVAAILSAGGFPEDHVFTEKDYNDWSTVNNGDAYGFAKVSAERVAAHGASVFSEQFDHVAINPHVVLGPVLCKAHTKSSAALIRQVIYGNSQNSYFAQYVDVREVAFAHAEALVRPDAGGKRFILCNDQAPASTMELGSIAAEACPEYEMSASAANGSWSVWLAYQTGFLAEYQYAMATRAFPVSNSRSKHELGVEYRSMKETVGDCAMSMIDGGYIKGRPK